MVQLQAKIQELAEHVPKGHIPRTMTVHLRGELTRKVGFLYVNFHELLSRSFFFLLHKANKTISTSAADIDVVNLSSFFITV